MKTIFESLMEIEKDPEQRRKALAQLFAMYNRKDIKNWSDYSDEDLAAARAAVKIAGRKHDIGKQRRFTTGNFIDAMERGAMERQKSSGSLPAFTGKASTAKQMAEVVAAHTNGQYYYKFGRVWTSGIGQRTKDPEDHIQYKTEEDLESAWEWIQSKGKQIHFKENPRGSLITGIQIGRYLLQKATLVRGAFSSTPETTYLISVRTAKIANTAGRTKLDITDQQAAALRDIAQTKSNNVMGKLKAIMSLFQGEEDVKQIIDNSKKINPQDKAKLDAIIAGAGSFKEPQ
jgi:hypothetical protein